jgi:hypothetical protein
VLWYLLEVLAMKDRLGWWLIQLFETPYLGGFIAVLVTLFFVFILGNDDWLGEIYPD